MKISLTKIKNWSPKNRLKEIEKRLKEIEKDPDISEENKNILKQVFLILKVQRRDNVNVNESLSIQKVSREKVNVF